MTPAANPVVALICKKKGNELIRAEQEFDSPSTPYRVSQMDPYKCGAINPVVAPIPPPATRGFCISICPREGAIEDDRAGGMLREAVSKIA